MIRIDPHVHTIYSTDGLITSKDLVYECNKKGIDCVAICDHNTIHGALKFKEEINLKIIVGEEINTREGEIIGLFLKEEISSGLSPAETIIRIKDQGGLIYLPHPFDTWRKSILSANALSQIFNQIEIVEIFNSRSLLKRCNNEAFQFCKKYGFFPAVGSDAHTKYEIGNSFLEMDDFDSKDDFIINIKQAKLFTKKTSILMRLWIKFLKSSYAIK